MESDREQTKCSQCTHPDGIEIRLDGEHPLDPCVYELAETHHNVTVEVLRCRKCGRVSIGWYES